MRELRTLRNLVGEPRSRRTFVATLAAGSAVVAGGCLSGNGESQNAVVPALLDGGTMVKSPSCSCCKRYLAHLRDRGADLEVENTDDLRQSKRDLGVPRDAQSCHTVRTDDYLVEGHVPLPAIEKLAAETPDVAGIALPDMPAGAPGMGGETDGALTVYAFSRDGTVEPFAEV